RRLLRMYHHKKAPSAPHRPSLATALWNSLAARMPIVASGRRNAYQFPGAARSWVNRVFVPALFCLLFAGMQGTVGVRPAQAQPPTGPIPVVVLDFSVQPGMDTIL